MGGPILISLESILAFISSILGDKIKEILKRKESSEKAKKKAFNFYENLGQFKTSISSFINTLRIYAYKVKVGAPDDKIREVEDTLYVSDRELKSAFSLMIKSLEELCPQLEIHHYPLYKTINDKKNIWFIGVGDLEFTEAVIEAEEGSPQRLECLIAEQEKYCKDIEECLQELRTFLSAQFSFKDSF